NAARARLRRHRRRDLRRGFHGDRANLAQPWPGSSRSRGTAAVAARGIQVMRERIACLGAGRMGRGIAVGVACAGHPVSIVDFKPRAAEAFDKLSADAITDICGTLASLAQCGLFDADKVDAIAARVSVVREADAGAALSSSSVIFEGVPEVL